MRRSFLVALLCTATLATPALGLAQTTLDPFLEPPKARTPESGFSIGARVGYGFAMGSVSNGVDLTSIYSGMVPLQVDAGWRFNPSLYLGAYFQYAFLPLASQFKTANFCDSGVSCSGSDIRVGVELAYTFLPYQTVMPWVGVGFGYEWAKTRYEVSGQSVDETLSGWEFLHLSVGADYRVATWFRMGPFATFTLGQYGTLSTPLSNGTIGPNQDRDLNKALHEWLQLGIKGTFDL